MKTPAVLSAPLAKKLCVVRISVQKPHPFANQLEDRNLHSGNVGVVKDGEVEVLVRERLSGVVTSRVQPVSGSTGRSRVGVTPLGRYVKTLTGEDTKTISDLWRTKRLGSKDKNG